MPSAYTVLAGIVRRAALRTLGARMALTRCRPRAAHGGMAARKFAVDLSYDFARHRKEGVDARGRKLCQLHLVARRDASKVGLEGVDQRGDAREIFSARADVAGRNLVRELQQARYIAAADRLQIGCFVERFSCRLQQIRIAEFRHCLDQRAAAAPQTFHQADDSGARHRDTV